MGLMVTGILFVLLSIFCFGLMAGIGEAVLPGEYQEAYRQWLRVVPPDNPAFVVMDDTFSEARAVSDCVPPSWPLPEGIGFFTQPFASDEHPGIDVGVPIGTPIMAPTAGQVVWAGWEDSATATS